MKNILFKSPLTCLISLLRGVMSDIDSFTYIRHSDIAQLLISDTDINW